MRKVKNACLILLAVLLVAAGGLLPMGAARIQDETTANVAQYADIEALQLKLEEEKPVNFYQKLALIVNGSGSEVKPDMMRILKNEVLETAYAALQPYVEIYGVSFADKGVEFYPTTVWDEIDPDTVNGYWHVYLPLKESKNGHVSVILDDETGKILAIELLDLAMDIPEEYLQGLLADVCAVYLNTLEITPVAEWPVETAEWEDKGEKQIGAHFQFIDVHYGEANVEIRVHSDGFSIVPT